VAPRITFLAVVGESFRQDALARLLAAHPDHACLIALVPEPENPVDANAIKVVSGDDSAMLGYLSRKNAEEFHEAAAALNALGTRYQATIYGGEPDKPGIGLSFDAKPMYDWQDRQYRAEERQRRAKRKDTEELKNLRRQLRAVTRERDKALRALGEDGSADVDESPTRTIASIDPTPSQPAPPQAITSPHTAPQPLAVQSVAPTTSAPSPKIKRMLIVAAVLIAFALFALLH
jgi:hypothetical protein